MSRAKVKAKGKGGVPLSAPVEKLGAVELYGGRAVGDMVRTSDPDGGTVVQIHRRGDGPAARMHSRGTIDRPMFQASEQFRADFELAQLSGNYVHIDMSRTTRGGGEISDRVLAARQRCNSALRYLGMQGNALTQLSLAAWYILGAQESLEDFSRRMQNTGKQMNQQRAAGLVGAACEKLAIHYELIRREDMKDREFLLGYRTALDRISSLLSEAADNCLKRGNSAGAAALSGEAQKLRERMIKFAKVASAA